MTETILDKVATGDPEAIDACLARYGSLVWSLARRFSANATDAEDAVQEIFVDVWRHAKRFDPEVAAEATFVAMIARRRLIDRRRKSARETTTTSLDHAAHAPAAAASNSLQNSDEAAIVRSQLEKLRPEERSVLELAICQGLTQAQISERTALPLGTVKTHARRGLIRLRQLVAEQQRPVEGGAR